MTIQPFKAVYPNFDLIASADDFFNTVKEEFTGYWNSGFFLEDPDDAIFIYHINSPESQHRGLIASVSIRDYLEGRIKPHENTLPAKEQKMTSLLLRRKAMIKPVLLTYRPNEQIERMLRKSQSKKPFIKVKFSDNEEHLIYKVSDPEVIAKLRDLFAHEVGEAYIADGHHRCTTGAKLFESVKPGTYNLDFSSLLTVLLPFDDVIIHDYNRVVEILREISPTMFMARLSESCIIEPLPWAAKPKKKFEMTLYLNQEWYKLTWRQEVIEKYAERPVILDGEILNNEILNAVLGITDVRDDARLKYIEGIAGLEGLTDKVHKNTYRIGFCLYPVDIEEIVAISDKGQTLPPKSTWFEPRIKNGLLAQSF